MGDGEPASPVAPRSRCSLRCTTGARAIPRPAPLPLFASALRRADCVAASRVWAGRRPPTGGPRTCLPTPNPSVGPRRQRNHGRGGGAPAAGSPPVERDPSPPLPLPWRARPATTHQGENPLARRRVLGNPLPPRRIRRGRAVLGGRRRLCSHLHATPGSPAGAACLIRRCGPCGANKQLAPPPCRCTRNPSPCPPPSFWPASPLPPLFARPVALYIKRLYGELPAKSNRLLGVRVHLPTGSLPATGCRAEHPASTAPAREQRTHCCARSGQSDTNRCGRASGEPVEQPKGKKQKHAYEPVATPLAAGGVRARPSSSWPCRRPPANP